MNITPELEISSYVPMYRLRRDLLTIYSEDVPPPALTERIRWEVRVAGICTVGTLGTPGGTLALASRGSLGDR